MAEGASPGAHRGITRPSLGDPGPPLGLFVETVWGGAKKQGLETFVARAGEAFREAGSPPVGEGGMFKVLLQAELQPPNSC